MNNITNTNVGNPIIKNKKFASGYTSFILSIKISPVSSSGQNSHTVRNIRIINRDIGIFFVSSLQKNLIQKAIIIAINNGTK
tara:strand:+ start:240 stop:485 length:246 start_codon:yes stop_codon:yes gene_type:complete